MTDNKELDVLVERLNARRITGMYGNNDPGSWDIHLAEGVDPLCQEAAAALTTLRERAEKAEAALADARRDASALLEHLPENWGDQVIEGGLFLYVEFDAIVRSKP